MKERLSILILGKGGKESALARKILESPRTERLYVAPAADIAGVEALPIDPLDFASVAEAVKDHGIDMVIVSSEEAIISGACEALADCGSKVISPDSQCAQLEGSKEFAKEFMSRHAIPTPRFMTVTAETIDEGMSFLESLQPPYVLKADGPAAGRGVLILHSLADAKDTLTDMIEGMFDESSSTVVIEEHLEGRECSVFLALDGEERMILPVAQDYKRLLPDDKGPNTPGMGSVSPVDFADEEFLEKVERHIINPTLRGFAEEGLDYRGILYLGLIECDGEPLLLEYNVRLGDPEAEAVLPRMESDIVDMLEGIADQTIGLKKLKVRPEVCVAVAVCSDPREEDNGEPAEITGIEECEHSGCMVFPAKMRCDSEGRRFAAGFRIVVVSAMDENRAHAAEKALKGASMIKFNGAYFRDDIK